MENSKFSAKKIEELFMLARSGSKNQGPIKRTEGEKIFKASFSRENSGDAKRLADLFQQLFDYQPVICEKKKEDRIEVWSSKTEVIRHIEDLLNEVKEG